MKSSESLTPLFVSAVGKKLLAIMGLFHVFNKERSQFPDELEFIFEGELRGKVYKNSLGNALCFSDNSLVEYDMQEDGSMKIFCVSNESYFIDVVGCKLISVFVVKSLREKSETGIQLQFDGSRNLSILNLGDDLYTFNEIPEKIIDEEMLVFIPANEEQSDFNP